MPRNKVTAKVHTKQGMPIKVWANSRTGNVLPSNWKQQAGFLAGEVEITKRMENRRKRRVEERARGLATWKASKSWVNIPAILEKAGVAIHA